MTRRGKVAGRPVKAHIQRLSKTTNTFVTVQNLVLRVTGNVLMQPEPGLLVPSVGAPSPHKRLKLWADWPEVIDPSNKQITQGGDSMVIPPHQPNCPPGYDGTYPVDDCLPYVGHHVEVYITRPQHLASLEAPSG